MNRNYIHSYVEKNGPNICEIVVRKNGEEIYADEWNGYRRDDCVHVASVTKSMVNQRMETFPGSLKDKGGYVVYDMYYNA